MQIRATDVLQAKHIAEKFSQYV